MIKDRLENASIYYNISQNLKKGFEWLISTDLKNIKPDRYVIDGDRIYANIQEYETKHDAKYEAHRKYIDIQYMIKGKELVGVCEKSFCTPSLEYDLEKDIEFLDCEQEEGYQLLDEGQFLVFFPSDAHKPSISLNEKLKVKKVIVKVAVD